MSLTEGIVHEESEEAIKTDSFFPTEISHLGDVALPFTGKSLVEMKKKPSVLIKWMIMQNKIKEQITLEEICI